MRTESLDHLELHPLTEWPATAELDPDETRRLFDAATPFTIGVEEELMLIEPSGTGLAPVSPELLARLDGDPRFSKELRMSQLEIITPVCQSAAEAGQELARARRDLVVASRGLCRLAAAGTHPISTDWGPISEERRYRDIADELAWAAFRSLVCGLHVHVAVPGADRALAVYNALRGYLPEIGALAANSPFFEGADTGLCSVRPKLFQAMPRSGCPPAFSSWSALAQFVAWGRRGGLFPDASHFWWNLRLHPVHGTLELRVADAQTRVEEAVAVAAFFQALVVTLADRYDAGEELPVPDSFRVSENDWRGLRYGVRGWLVDLQSGEPRPTRDRLVGLLQEVRPAAERLGCVDELQQAQVMLAGNGAEHQRYVAEREGLEGLVDWLVQETEGSALAHP